MTTPSHPSPAAAPVDPGLRALLRRADPAARPAPADPLAFASAVRARIQVADTDFTRRGRPVRGFGDAFPRLALPLAASLAFVAAIAAGAATAYSRERAVQTEAYAAAYARSIDPWQMRAPDASTGAPAPAHHHP